MYVSLKAAAALRHALRKRGGIVESLTNRFLGLFLIFKSYNGLFSSKIATLKQALYADLKLVSRA